MTLTESNWDNRHTDPLEPVEERGFPGARTYPQKGQYLGTDSTGLSFFQRKGNLQNEKEQVGKEGRIKGLCSNP